MWGISLAFETPDWNEAFGSGVKPIALDLGKDASVGRYDLATAIRIIRRVETSPGREAVFAEIKRKNRIYRFVDRFYSWGGASSLKPLVLLAYMLKCALSPGPFLKGRSQALAIANFPNERHTIERLTALLPGVRVRVLSLRRRHLIGRGQLRTALRLLLAAPRLWPFLARLARSHGFMPSARIASGIAFYLAFSRRIAERPWMSATIVASNYSPEALGLAAAAHAAGRRVIYANHAPVPANSQFVPPVLADCAVFYGDQTLKTYWRRSHCSAEVALIGQAGTARPLEWTGEIRQVGIFLTALTRSEAVEDLVSAIAAGCPGVPILVRNHPVALLKSDFSAVASRFANVEVTIGNPLEDEVTACDLIFCGNSGVAMNILRGGRPVAYLPALDALDYDYNGFIESGLVCEVSGWSADLYNRLRSFYTNPAWQGVMQGYDASYGADRERVELAAAAVIRRYLDCNTRSVSSGVPRGIAREETFPSTDLKCDVGMPRPGRMQRMLSRVKASPSAMSATT